MAETMKNTGIEWIGKIPEEWEIKRFKYCVEICNGRDYKDLEVDEGGYPVLGSGGEFARASKFSYDKPSVLLGRKGTIDKPLYYDKPFWTVDTMFYTRIPQYMNPRFVYYMATQIRFDYYSTQTALPSMTQTDLGSEKLPVPSKTEQKKIADFLDKQTAKLEAIIKTNEHQLEILKKYKKSLITQTVTKGLNKNVKMKDSGINWIGKIPEEWDVKRFKYCVEICNGRDYKDLEVDEGGYPVLGSGGEFARASKFSYDKPSVLLGRKGTIDKPLYYDKPFWTVDTMFYTKIPQHMNPRFVYYMSTIIRFDYYSTQTALPSMTQTDLGSEKLPVPDKKTQKEISDYLDKECTKIDMLISKKQQAIDTILKYKKSLIYEYVTGKKRIK